MTPLVLFCGLAFLFSWALWLAVIGSQHGWIATHIPLTPFGAFGPAVAAVLTTAILQGRHALIRLGKTVVQPPADWRCLIAATLAWPRLVLGALPVVRLSCQTIAPTGSFPLSRLPAAMLEVFLFTSLAEELGWRGFLLPQLLTRTSAVTAALIVGAVWAAWHLPLFYISTSAQASMPFGLFAISVVATSCIYTAFYLWSRQSLLTVLVLHTSQDLSLGLGPAIWPEAGSSAAFWYGYLGLVLVVGVAVVVWLRKSTHYSASAAVERIVAAANVADVS